MEDNNENEAKLDVKNFYKNANIFITGGTGFIGKVLIEKLLRVYPDINKIFLMLRRKKTKSISTRIKEMTSEIVFTKLKEMYPDFEKKIIGISGDMSLPDLGLSKMDRETLEAEVSVVFHMGASVNFNDSLRYIALTNVEGTQIIIDLCKRMDKLKSVVYVSTAFFHYYRTVIKDQFYKSPMTSENLKKLLESVDNCLLQSIEKKIIGDWPNTYTFSKAVAEDVVRTEGLSLPIGIYRPACVSSAYKEPLPGWIDNYYAVSGMTFGGFSGVLKSVWGDARNFATVVPVDWSVDVLICCAVDIAVRHASIRSQKNEHHIPIFTYSAPIENKISWDEFRHMCQIHGNNYPLDNAAWYYNLRVNKNWLIHWLSIIFLQFLPALLIDVAFVCVGKEPKMMSISYKMFKFSQAMSYFVSVNWEFKMTNVPKLWEKLSPEDKKIFHFDMYTLDWDDYSKVVQKGIKLYMHKDSMSNIESALTRWKRLYWLDRLLKLTLLYIALRFVLCLAVFIFKSLH